MRHTPTFVLSDVDEVKRLIHENPWATIVSHTAAGLVASHYPVVLEQDDADPGAIVLVSHVGRPDERSHELGEHEVMVIVQGPHGYVSPGWYPAEQIIPTWNHVTAHLWGTPEILSDDENFRVLGELVDHFERVMPEPSTLTLDDEGSRRVAKGTVGIRLRVTRFDARAKLSQNKAPEVVDRIVDELEHGEHYAQPALAAEMRRVRDR
ncbi:MULTISPECIES: FMN-binding negative transcriptional regulator [unclassified Frigoribacterium]|jgi:transcriptional regulator|uniref:FMN-binding negative transcriptional regulator n=1 Tax=unclassified Frigoribacterium TaxID=2627005 RepID=UPI000F4843D1|nr:MULTISPECIES: FMN-binding negative transcriptional regulator [unclassified Frigoribacterium]MBD8484170.1 FMN-binding negative transcriptional regulator [Frigoribacterium sp. CFBP 8759]NQW88500.1 FMN-binding negative transcriptional regulator [Frigoribacterium sp. VKM Ac-2860]NQX08691.1 FMN-binding negative transcriptional regulator [Frigoribacterium sp. VKM Ac-2859]ROS50182.1 PaiB family negative transcriptional regulator [Frigoribacterium sp. PhB118]WAC52940.1 FMN-binding negative transcri